MDLLFLGICFLLPSKKANKGGTSGREREERSKGRVSMEAIQTPSAAGAPGGVAERSGQNCQTWSL